MILLALFPLLGSTIPEGPFSYPGQSHLREEITVDPENSPVFDQVYKRFVEQLPLNEKELLHNLMTYLREQVFDLRDCNKESIETLIHNQPLLSLDFFLENKAGVCRHFALLTTLLLHRLACEGFLEGQPFFIRENLAHSRHAWTLFATKEALWHLDPYWNIIENAQDPKGLERLKAIYGIEPIVNALQQVQLHLK